VETNVSYFPSFKGSPRASSGFPIRMLNSTGKSVVAQPQVIISGGLAVCYKISTFDINARVVADFLTPTDWL